MTFFIRQKIMEVLSKNNDEQKHELEPIRGSAVVLIARLLVILLLFETLYGGVFYILTLGIPLPFGLHHHVSVVIFVMEIIKIIIQLFLILNVTLSWANNAYYLSGKHLIRRTGILHVKEDVFHFDNIRSISINQSFLGKIFHYGDITLKTSASGGYQGDIVLAGIANPQKYEEILKSCF